MWRLWAKALGQKEGRDEKEADKIAIIRSLIMLQLVLTNLFIISGNILSFYKHFNDVPTERLPVQHQSIKEEYHRWRR
tara:strand:- start:176 stop:409 length:234 start_codon:yes stop_codon:yes gene_type:complete